MRGLLGGPRSQRFGMGLRGLGWGVAAAFALADLDSTLTRYGCPGQGPSYDHSGGGSSPTSVEASQTRQ